MKLKFIQKKGKIFQVYFIFCKLESTKVHKIPEITLLHLKIITLKKFLKKELPKAVMKCVILSNLKNLQTQSH